MTINLITGIQSYYLQGLLEISSPQNHTFDTESLLQGLAKPHHLLHTQDYHGIDAAISLIHNTNGNRGNFISIIFRLVNSNTS